MTKEEELKEKALAILKEIEPKLLNLNFKIEVHINKKRKLFAYNYKYVSMEPKIFNLPAIEKVFSLFNTIVKGFNPQYVPTYSSIFINHKYFEKSLNTFASFFPKKDFLVLPIRPFKKVVSLPANTFIKYDLYLIKVYSNKRIRLIFLNNLNYYNYVNIIFKQPIFILPDFISAFFRFFFHLENETPIRCFLQALENLKKVSKKIDFDLYLYLTYFKEDIVNRVLETRETSLYQLWKQSLRRVAGEDFVVDLEEQDKIFYDFTIEDDFDYYFYLLYLRFVKEKLIIDDKEPEYEPIIIKYKNGIKEYIE